MPEDDQTGLRVATAQAELEQDRQDCSNNSAKCKKGGSFSPPIVRQVHQNQQRNKEPRGSKTKPKKKKRGLSPQIEGRLRVLTSSSCA